MANGIDNFGSLVGQASQDSSSQQQTQALNQDVGSSYFLFGNYGLTLLNTRLLIEYQPIGSYFILGSATNGILGTQTLGTNMIWGNAGALWGTALWGGTLTSYSTLYDNTSSQTVTNSSKNALASWFGGSALAYPSYIALGNRNITTDTSGNGNNGTITGATYTTGTVGNYALNFNGSSDYVETSSNPFGGNQTTATVSCWVNFTDFTQAHNLLYRIFGHSLYPRINVTASRALTTQHRIDGVTINTAGYTIPSTDAGSWHHILVTYDVSTGTNLYYDGILRVVDTSTGNYYDGGTNAMRMGWDSNLSYYLKGKLDEVLVYNRALTADEVSTLYSKTRVTSGLVGAWGFENPTDFSASDTTLNYEQYRTTFDSYTHSTDKVEESVKEFNSTISAVQGYPISEIGSFNAASSGTMFSRYSLSDPLTFDATRNYRITIQTSISDSSLWGGIATTAGMNLMRDWFAGVSVTAPTYMAWGTGTTAVAASDTTLEGESVRNIIGAKAVVNTTVSYETLMTYSQGNGTNITKSGIFNSISGATLWFEQKYNAIAKANTFQIDETDMITIS